ncbi:MAG: sterol desaturase family protein [Rhizomicrobium sp.]
MQNLLSLVRQAAEVLPLSLLVWVGHMIVFHGAGAIFAACDRTGGLHRFRVRDRARLAYSELLPRVLFNQTCILLPAMWLCGRFGLAFVGSHRIRPGFALAAIVLMTIGHDVVQYVSHRFLLHNPRFRALGHALHHSTGASCSISACYMSAPDFFLTIVCPYLAPLILVGGGSGNLDFQLVVACLGAVGGLYEHSGYDFAAFIGARATSRRPFRFRRIVGSMVSSRAHGEHHRRSRVSFSDGFGSPGLCDTFLRTRWDLR